jgi:hypothetical protein
MNGFSIGAVAVVLVLVCGPIRAQEPAVPPVEKKAEAQEPGKAGAVAPGAVQDKLPEDMRWPALGFVVFFFVVGTAVCVWLIVWQNKARMSEMTAFIGIPFFLSVVMFLLVVASMVKFEAAIIASFTSLLAALAGYCVGRI